MPHTALLVSLHVGGFIVLGAGFLAYLRNRRVPRSTALRIAVLVTGVVVATVVVNTKYYLDDSHHVLGFPFLAAVFIRHGDHWVDHLGPLALPAYVGNLLFGLALPQIALFAWRKLSG